MEFEFWHHQLGDSVALVTFVNVRILGPQNFYADASASIMTIGLPNTNLHNFKAKYVQQILEKTQNSRTTQIKHTDSKT